MQIFKSDYERIHIKFLSLAYLNGDDILVPCLEACILGKVAIFLQ